MGQKIAASKDQTLDFEAKLKELLTGTYTKLDSFETGMLDRTEIVRLRQAKLDKVLTGNLDISLRNTCSAVLSLASNDSIRHSELDQPEVSLGMPDAGIPQHQQVWQQLLDALKPWKKGPFNLFGTQIDSEWRSDLKWDRLSGHFKSLQGLKVADIGCHNGYFMYRMAACDPAAVVGFEPVGKHWITFALLQMAAHPNQLSFEPLGVEHFNLWKGFFDRIFCLGILYHHPDPIGLLRKIHTGTARGGQLIVDCQGIPGSEPVALMPASRYGNNRGYWFLPTKTTLVNWLRRSGWQNVEVFYSSPLSTDEQRSTPWAQIPSLVEQLSPTDPNQTIEGYPAPWRFYARADR